MLLDCPICARSYHVSRADLGESGREVVCPRCDASWRVDADGRTVPAEASAQDIRTTVVSTKPPAVAFLPPVETVVRPSLIRRTAPVLSVTGALAFAMVLIGAREPIVRLIPRTAQFYTAAGLPVNVRGLEFVSLVQARDSADPSFVVISGSIHNVARRRVTVPRLAFLVQDASGKTVMTWTEAAPLKMLGAGRNLPFASAPHAIPADAKSVLVRFVPSGTVGPPPLHVARAATE